MTRIIERWDRPDTSPWSTPFAAIRDPMVCGVSVRSTVCCSDSLPAPQNVSDHDWSGYVPTHPGTIHPLTGPTHTMLEGTRWRVAIYLGIAEPVRREGYAVHGCDWLPVPW